MNSALRVRLLALNFAITVLVSAFLLFQVQPTLAALKPLAHSDEPSYENFPLWTDHHSNLFEILK